jgi:hypothetical protein
MVRYLSFHISCFAFLRYFLKCKWQAHHRVTHTLCFGKALVTGVVPYNWKSNRWDFHVFCEQIAHSFLSFLCDFEALLDNMSTIVKMGLCTLGKTLSLQKRVPNWYAFEPFEFTWCEEWEFKKHTSIGHSRGEEVGEEGEIVEWYNDPSIISYGCIQSPFFILEFLFIYLFIY